MINLNTINQINDIMTILNNTRKAMSKPQADSAFDKQLQQTTEQTNIQTPAQVVQQTTILPSAMPRNDMYDDTCCVKGCNNPAVLWINNKHYCKEHDPANRIDTEED